MWNQPDEYFIEAVSNASMDLFSRNTLARFSNKLASPIELHGDWVVGLQEIFYPMDISPTSRTISLYLFLGGLTSRTSTTLTLDATDDASKIIDKINAAILKAYNNAKSKRPKRQIKTSIEQLFQQNITEMSPDEKNRYLEQIKATGSNEIKDLVQRIQILSNEMVEKDGKVKKLEAKLAEKEKIEKKLIKNEETKINLEADFEKYKKMMQKMITDQSIKISELQRKGNDDAKIYNLQQNLKAEQERSKSWEGSVLTKMSEIDELNKQMEKLKQTHESEIRKMEQNYENLKKKGEAKLAEVNGLLSASKNNEQVATLVADKEKLEKEHKDSLLKLETKMKAEKKKFDEEKKTMNNREKTYQKQLEVLTKERDSLKLSMKALEDQLKQYVPFSDVEELQKKINEINVLKASTEAINRDLKSKHESLKADLANLTDEIKVHKLEKEQLLVTIDKLKKELFKLNPIIDTVVDVNEDDKIPRVELVNCQIIIHRIHQL